MSSDKKVIARVEHLSKSFRLPHDKHNGVKQLIIGFFKRKRGYETQHVLRDISFEIHEGEFFGIVGRNGSGKSTLLKLLAGIYTPDKGSAHIDGSVTPFIELGVGFNPELTGRENIYLNAALLNMSRSDVDEIYDEIVRFAELERFMDQKLKNYSSGMQVRLAFSIAIRAKSDVLIMDEVLAVGDASFQKKCFEVFRELKQQGRTIILVTHDMGNVEKFCDKVLILDKGKILSVTSPGEASSIYARLNVNEATVSAEATKNRYGTNEVVIHDISMSNGAEKTNVFSMGETLTMTFNLKRKAGYENTPIACGIAIYNEDGVNVIGPNSENSKIPDDTNKIVCEIPRLPLVPGSYDVTVALYHRDKFNEYFDFMEKWLHFDVVSDHVTHGLVEVTSEWKV